MNAETIACIINEAKDSSDWMGWDTQYTIVEWQDTEYKVELDAAMTTATIIDERTGRKLARTAW